ncbi:MAG: hypothetical protein WBV59_00265 [Anaerolineae bacterium]
MHHQGNWRHVRSLMSRLAPIMLIPILSGCLLFSKTSMFSRGDGWYHYDPTTLPQALERGEPLSLTPEATVATSDVLDSKPVQWTQADFLQIADAFQQQELAESLSAWKFSQLWFELYCADVAFGPQHLTIELYREYPRDEGGMRLVQHSVLISPRRNQVGWTENELWPVLGRQPSLDLTRIKVPVEQALRIAEAQGGQAARETAQNQCLIYLLLTASRAQNGWEVTYSGFAPRGSLFKLYVNEETGRHRR